MTNHKIKPHSSIGRKSGFHPEKRSSTLLCGTLILLSLLFIKNFKLMPKISLDELEHMEDEVSFEKVHNKKGKIAKQSKYPEKKKHREKKINY